MGFTFYKPNQGRHARVVTALFLGVILLFGCWTLYEEAGGGTPGQATVVTVSVLFAVGASIVGMLIYGFESRIKGLGWMGEKGRRFIDFLVDVEAELRKVAWPSRQDLFASTWVVIVTMVVFAVFLVVMDRVLQLGMTLLGQL